MPPTVVFLGLCLSITVMAGSFVAAWSPALAEYERFPQRREIVALVVLLPASFLMAQGIFHSDYGVILVAPFFASLLPALTAGIAGRQPFLYGCLANTLLCFWICRLLNYDSPEAKFPLLFYYWLASLAFAVVACLPHYLKWIGRTSR